jgi:hypothetical protein
MGDKVLGRIHATVTVKPPVPRQTPMPLTMLKPNAAKKDKMLAIAMFAASRGE